MFYYENNSSFQYEGVMSQYYENTYAGNNLRIMGSVPDDFRSTIAVISTLEDFQPDVFCLELHNYIGYHSWREKQI